ncbi:MAG: hypothetical protein GY950_36985, partial [bacterium]|nr:hypothetical protein [bacterium]
DPAFVPPGLHSSYKDVVIEEMVEKRNPATAVFWKNQLQGYKRLEFFEAHKREAQLPRMKIYYHDLSPGILKKVRRAAQIHNTSVRTLCFAAYAYIMNMLSYENDIVVGCVTNNRPLKPDGEKLLGCFLNTVPIRLHIPAGLDWQGYIQRVDKKMLEVKAFERLPLFEIARAIGEKNNERNPIFDTPFNFMDFFVIHQGNWPVDGADPGTD